MALLQVTILLLVGSAGTAVVLTRTLDHQIIGISAFGMVLALMFTIFQAPDVALSQIVIGAVGLPLMLLLARGTLRRHQRGQEREAGKER